MIQQNYYQGFVERCKANPKITRIPSIDELENAGCKIDMRFYLVIESGMQYNPIAINPIVIADQKAKQLFIDQTPQIDIPKDKKPTEDAKLKPTPEPIKTAFDEVIEQKTAEVKERERYIRVTTAQEYIKRGYEMGVKDTLEKLNIQEPTFEELMEGIEL